MNALVSMHGIWLLAFLPAAAVIAWRYSNATMQKLALYWMILSTAALSIWFGSLAFQGTELSSSLYDRVMHAIGVIIGSVSIPVLQVIAATALFLSWPKRWEYVLPAAIVEPASQH